MAFEFYVRRRQRSLKANNSLIYCKMFHMKRFMANFFLPSFVLVFNYCDGLNFIIAFSGRQARLFHYKSFEGRVFNVLLTATEKCWNVCAAILWQNSWNFIIILSIQWNIKPLRGWNRQNKIIVLTLHECQSIVLKLTLKRHQQQNIK